MGRDLLAGRTALVTGGSGGIGRALALQLAAEGTAVALGFRTSRESAEQLAAEIAEQGRPVVAIEADLSKPEAPVELAEAVEFALGPIDILVANAGVGRVASYEEVDGALFDETLAVNLRAPYLLARHVLPGMRERGFGRIVFISSVAGFIGGIVGPHYAASKAALHGLTHYFAPRVAPDGVTVNAIAPALIEDTGIALGDPQQLAARIPVGRLDRSIARSAGVFTEMTRATPTVAGLMTLVLAAAAWVVAVEQMKGMDMGGATELGSFGSFVGFWVPMMAAMMLPSVAPAVLRRNRVQTSPLFVGSYLAVWILVGLAVYPAYRPHGSLIAGALTVGAGLYELTPLKHECRRRCRESVRSGFTFGLYCLGSSIGLMLMLLALGVMSIAWMSVIAVLVLAQKLLPERLSVDVPVALVIVSLGITVAVGP